MTLAIGLLSFLLSALPPVPAPTPAYTGFWLVTGQEAVLEISREGDRYMGRYVAFRTDADAPNARLNTYYFKDMKDTGEQLSGNVTDPNTGKVYKATLKLTGPETLKVRIKVMGPVAASETWTRQPSGK